MTDHNAVPPRVKLIEKLTDRGLVQVLDYSSRNQEKVADGALDEGDQSSRSYYFVVLFLPSKISFPVLIKLLNLSSLLVMSLKRLLIGSISLSEDSQHDEEHEEEQPEKLSHETEAPQPTG